MCIRDRCTRAPIAATSGLLAGTPSVVVMLVGTFSSVSQRYWYTHRPTLCVKECESATPCDPAGLTKYSGSEHSVTDLSVLATGVVGKLGQYDGGGMSTRKLILASLFCGLAILLAFALQLILASS